MGVGVGDIVLDGFCTNHKVKQLCFSLLYHHSTLWVWADCSEDTVNKEVVY